MGALRNRLGLDRLERSTARVTPPHASYGVLSGTGSPVRYIAPPPASSRPFDVDYAMQCWFQQIRQERGHMHVQLRRMGEEVPEMTAVYLRMRELGYAIRREAGTAINHEPQFNMQQTFDPYGPNVYFSNRRLIYKICELHGIAVADMSPTERLTAMEYGGGQQAVYAYLQVFETLQPPVLVIDRDPYGIGLYRAADDAKSIQLWSWYAANCLSKLLYDEALYSGRGAIVETIAPFDPRAHAAFFPLAHSFTKSLLHITAYNGRCPPQWLCGCNRIEDLLVQRPQAHPWPTGELPSDVLAQHVAQQQQQQQQQQDYGQYGEAAPPSRGMTPPRGIPGDRLREYRRQQTDPNLRNPNDHS